MAYPEFNITYISLLRGVGVPVEWRKMDTVRVNGPLDERCHHASYQFLKALANTISCSVAKGVYLGILDFRVAKEIYILLSKLWKNQQARVRKFYGTHCSFRGQK